MKTSEKIEQVSASMFAVHKAIAEAGLPKKDAKGQAKGNKDYRYLSLPALIEFLNVKLKEAQLYATQEMLGGQGFAEVTTTIWHISGQFIQFGPAFMPSTGVGEQAHGSANTYCRRYALAAVFNLAADEDDDAAPKRPMASSAAAGRGVGPSRPPASNVEVAPDHGEGDGAASTPLATDEQWMHLLQRTSGKTGEAVKLLNEKNGTDFTYQEAKHKATWAELEKAMA